MDRGALDQLLLHTGTLGSIYHKNPETFIRGAAGRALVDSPALNPLSRQLLVPLQREAPSAGPIVVPGPGPVEPGTEPVPSPLPASVNTSKPAPPLPPDSGTGSLEGDGSGGEEDEDEDAGFSNRRSAAGAYLVPATDPYASLDAAFVDDSERNMQLQFMRGASF